MKFEDLLVEERSSQRKLAAFIHDALDDYEDEHTLPSGPDFEHNLRGHFHNMPSSDLQKLRMFIKQSVKKLQSKDFEKSQREDLKKDIDKFSNSVTIGELDW